MDRTQHRAEIDCNYDAFARALGHLLPDHRDQSALMHDDQIVAFLDKPGDAYREGVARFGEATFSL